LKKVLISVTFWNVNLVNSQFSKAQSFNCRKRYRQIAWYKRRCDTTLRLPLHFSARHRI